VKLEALLAYLLFTGQAFIYNYTVVGSGIVFSVQSQYFHFDILKRIVRQRRDTILNRIILAVLNLGVGFGLVQNTFGITGTAYRPFGYRLGFSVTSTVLAPQTRGQGPTLGLTAIPNGGPAYKLFNQMIGVLLILQQLEIYSLSVGKGGRLVLGITGEILELKAFPKIIAKWHQAT
jgi:hypothetical protein